MKITETNIETLKQYVDDDANLKAILEGKPYYTTDLSKYVITNKTIMEFTRK